MTGQPISPPDDDPYISELGENICLLLEEAGMDQRLCDAISEIIERYEELQGYRQRAGELQAIAEKQEQEGFDAYYKQLATAEKGQTDA